MGKATTKWTHSFDHTISTGAQQDETIFLNDGSTNRHAETAVNLHGIRINIEIIVSGTAAFLPSFGHWALYVLPRSTTAVPTLNSANLDTQADTNAIWALGAWSAQFSTGKTTIKAELKTSRNL